MAAKDARIQPIYNCKHREIIELVDSDGTPIALASADTEIIKDGAAPVDSAAEMSEIATGYCAIDIPYSETAYKSIQMIPKSTGALTRMIKLYPVRLPVLRSGTAQAGAAATITLDSGASAKDGAYVGCLLRASNNTPAGIQGDCPKIIGYVGATKVATVDDAWTDTPTSGTTFEILVPSDMSLATLMATAAETATQVSTQMAILKNSATRDLFFTMRDSTNHNLATGKTVSGQVNIDGAGFGAVTGVITEVAFGWYKLAANATDRNGNMLMFHFTATGCDPTPILMVTGN